MNIRPADFIQAFFIPVWPDMEAQHTLDVLPGAYAGFDFLFDKALESGIEGVLMSFLAGLDALAPHVAALAGREQYLPGALTSRFEVQRRRSTERDSVLLPS